MKYIQAPKGYNAFILLLVGVTALFESYYAACACSMAGTYMYLISQQCCIFSFQYQLASMPVVSGMEIVGGSFLTVSLMTPHSCLLTWHVSVCLVILKRNLYAKHVWTTFYTLAIRFPYKKCYISWLFSNFSWCRFLFQVNISSEIASFTQ